MSAPAAVPRAAPPPPRVEPLARPRAGARLPRPAATALFAALAFAAVLAANVLRGATTSDFGSHDDEPAHVVTGLMARDWLASGELADPVAFAADYYTHYPKVAIGQWPPVFYAVQGVWTLLLGATPTSLVALTSLLAALLGAALFAALRRPCGTWVAAGTGALLLCLPLVQTYGARVMTEVPLALLVLLAVLAFGRFLETGRRRHAAAFAALSILAVLTKGNGLALALVPPLALPLARRLDLLRRPALWAAGAAVVVACAPWYAATLGLSSGTWAGGSRPSLAYALDALPFYARELVAAGGVAVAAAAVLGLVVTLAGRPSGTWAALAAALPALLAFHLVVPSSIDERHVVLLAAPWLAFAGAGVAWLARRPRLAPRGVPLPLLALLVLFAATTARFPRKDWHGYGAAVAAILADPANAGSRLLIASDAKGEGAFVAAAALAEERPGHFVLRGSKVLANSDWLGRDYRLLVGSVEELAAYAARVPVGILAIDSSIEPRRWRAHHELARRLVEEDPERWPLLGAFDVVRDGVVHPGALRVHRQRGHERLPPAPLDVHDVIGDRLREL